MKRLTVLALLLAASVDAAPSGSLVVEVSHIAAPAPRAPSQEARERGAALFQSRCSLCHGQAGEGDGPAARGLRPKPRRFSDAFWQASVDDADLNAVILGGGAARKLSPMMPASPDLKDKPAELDALVAYIRSLQHPAGTVAVTLTGGPESAPVKQVVHVDATPDGGATADVQRLPAGTYRVTVETAPGVRHCETSIVVAGDGKQVARCAPSALDEGTKR